jgi:hypothetical protein
MDVLTHTVPFTNEPVVEAPVEVVVEAPAEKPAK